MINKLLHWAAKKRGFVLEEKNRLVICSKVPDVSEIRVVTMAMATSKSSSRRIESLEGYVITPGGTIKFYITE